MKRLILIHGDKGGTGKSHTAHLTAAAYRAAGQPLLLIDGDAKNPGLHRAFNFKPDEVLRINVRKPEGIDQLFEAFLAAPGDVLVDLPAGGSDMTSRLVGGGTSEGTIDIETLFAEIDARLTILFVIDQGRDSVVALNEELQLLSNSVTDWIIVRNNRIDDMPFTRFEKWAAQFDLGRATILDMPRLDRKVIEVMIDAKANLAELSSLGTARWDGCRPPQTASQCAKVVVCQRHANGEDGEMKNTMIGVDLAKRVFQLHGATTAGEVKFRKKLSRDQFLAFMAAQPAALIVFEACGSASYWAREMEALGHEVRLIAPQYVERQPPWPVASTILAGGAERKTGMSVWRAVPPAS